MDTNFTGRTPRAAKKFKSIGKLHKRRKDFYSYTHSFNCVKCGRFGSVKGGGKTIMIPKLCKKCLSKQVWGKPVELQYYLFKNQTVKFPSITEFCRVFGLEGNAKHHFNDVLKGKRVHYKGWMLPNKDIKINFSKVKKVEMLLIKKAIEDYGK